MSQYFPKPFRSFAGNINVKVDLSNYATKTDPKNVTYVDTLSFSLKTNLANLKTEVDKLDIDKLAPVPVDLCKLSDVVKNDVVKKTVYDKLVANVNNIDTSNFVLKTKYNTDKTELENKIPDISNLATKTALTTVKNKIPSVSNLVTQNKTEKLLVENELNKLKTFDSSYFIGKSHFEEDGTQNYLVFQPINKCFKGITNTDYFSSSKSKGLSAESIKPPTTSDTSLTPALSYYGTKTRAKFTGSCLK